MRDKRAAAQVFDGMLKARIFDEALLGLRQPTEIAIVEKVREAAKSMLLLLKDGRFRGQTGPRCDCEWTRQAYHPALPLIPAITVHVLAQDMRQRRETVEYPFATINERMGAAAS